MSSYLVFDLETVDLRPDELSPATFDVIEGGVTVAGRQEATRPEGFPKPHECAVLAIGMAVLDAKGAPIVSNCITTEKSLESDVVHEFLGRASDGIRNQRTTLVTWNGRRFDFPVLIARALHFGLDMPWYYKARGLRYRYSTQGHIDVMDELADYGAGHPMKLGAAAELVGVAGKTMTEPPIFRPPDIDWPKLERYCMNDVRITGQLLVRWLRMSGEITAADVRRADEKWGTFDEAAHRGEGG